MKKILVDLSKIGKLHTVLGQFSAQFGIALSEKFGHEFEFHFLVPRNHTLSFSPLIKEVKVNLILKWWKTSHEQYDLWHSLYQFPSYRPSNQFKQLLTIHDLNFLVEKQDQKKEKYAYRLGQEIEKATRVSTISEFTKSKIKEQYPHSEKTIEVIHNGVKDLTQIKSSKPSFVPNQDFFFSISLFTHKKNFEVLIPMMKFFPKKKLVIAGDNNNAYGQKIKDLIKEHALASQVILPGIISESEKRACYEGCEAFFFPSLAEGFGLPVIEAMQYGIPCFLSKETSLPEVGGEVATYFDHFDPQYMAKLIKSNLAKFQMDPAYSKESIKDQAAKFTWENCMQKYIQLYRKLTR